MATERRSPKSPMPQTKNGLTCGCVQGCLLVRNNVMAPAH